MEFEVMPVEFWNVFHEKLPDQHVGNQDVCREEQGQGEINSYCNNCNKLQ